jgi:hypothetical protein
MQRLAGSVVDVDVVVAWVDGSDRSHRAKRQRYLAEPGGDAKPERVSYEERRFSDNEEIRFCLRSIHNTLCTYNGDRLRNYPGHHRRGADARTCRGRPDQPRPSAASWNARSSAAAVASSDQR